MERKGIVSCVAALLLLQFAGLSLASEAAPQNGKNQPEADGTTNTPSISSDDTPSDATEIKSKTGSSAGLPSLPLTQGVDEGAETQIVVDIDRSGKLIAQYTTKTKAVFVTTTKAALSTCFSATDATGCGGRRKKRSMVKRSLFMEPSLTSDLVASQESDSRDDRTIEFKDHESDRKAKKFTIWTTLFSTHTITTTFYYPGTTVTISGKCSVPGLGSSCFG